MRSSGKMNINDMSEREKTVILLRLIGCEVVANQNEAVYARMADGKLATKLVHPYYLYGSDNMALAWMVLNWVENQPDPILISMFSGWWEDVELWQLEPIEAQRMILDKVLEFADRCGMVKDDIGHVTYRGWSVIDKAYTLYPQENASDRGGEE